MELWDLYDIDRVKTGETIARGDAVPEGRYRLVVTVCVFDTSGRMLIQRRQPFKRGWPGYWDFTVGGCAVMGDDSRSAAAREVREEIGYQIDMTRARPALTNHFKNGFNDIYLIHRDIDISELTLQKEEVDKVKWATQAEILDMIDTGEFIPYHKSLIELIFFMKDSRSTRTRGDDGVPCECAARNRRINMNNGASSSIMTRDTMPEQ